MDYGYFNQFLDRPVDQNWWGTRIQHIVGVAAALAVTDHTSQAIFTRYLGKPLSFATHPAAFVAHTFFFIFTGVTLYCVHDAAFNPDHQGQRTKTAAGETYNSAVGSCTVRPTNAQLRGNRCLRRPEHERLNELTTSMSVRGSCLLFKTAGVV